MKFRNNKGIVSKGIGIDQSIHYLLKFSLLILFLTVTDFVCAQPTVAMRLIQTEIQSSPPKVCYEIELENTSNSDINLAGQNFRLFYNSSKIILDSIESYSLLPSLIYTDLTIVQSFVDADGSGLGGPFSYDNTLGFLNFYIDLNEILNGGVIIPANGGKLSLARLCFKILVEEDEVCIDLEFAQDPLTTNYAPVECVISSWISSSEQEGVIIDSILSINQVNDNSCIFLKENTFALCNDGIDNDGDGLIDCDDDECFTPQIDSVLAVQPIPCDFPQIGSITIVASTTNNLYSIDGGQTYSSDSIFINLVPGNYEVVVQNIQFGCTAIYGVISIMQQGCETGFCNDGIDNDGDGLIDCEDDECFTPQIDSVLVVQPIPCDFPQIGSITIVTSTIDNLYSIDAGQTYSSDPIFMGVASGTYDVIVQNMTSGCTASYGEVTIVEQGCETGFCNDGIDNDGDGLIDCDDDECITPQIDTVIVVQPIACETLQIGSISITTNTTNNVYSIDNGQTYSTESFFMSLAAGSYNVVVQNITSGCTVSYGSVSIVEQGCESSFCNDGIDNDGDGLIDCDDDECFTPQIDTVIVLQPIGCDTAQIGSISIVTNTTNNIFSIDGGQSYSSDSIFMDLDPSSYDIVVQNVASGCTAIYGEVTIDERGCELDFCNDGIDNDGDGLIDCDDDECMNDAICTLDIIFSNVISRRSTNDYLSVFLPNSLNAQAITIKIYDRWGNLMFDADFDNIDSHLKVDIADIDQWESGVFIIKATLTRGLDASESIFYNSLTVL